MSHPFHTLGVPHAMIRGIEELGIVTPTPVQEQVIPFLIQNTSDLIAQAQTGTGKTAAFGLPLLMKIDPAHREIQGLVLAPTRELAKQIGKQLFRYTKYCDQKIFIEVACGGDKIDMQIERLSRPTHILVATPGRLTELLEKDALTLEFVRYAVLDEADEMLSMGFKKHIVEILKIAAMRRATWLFSATFPDAVGDLIKGCLSANAHRIQIDTERVVNRDIDHRYYVCHRGEKSAFIIDYLKRQREERGLIFCRTKWGAIHLGEELRAAGLAVEVLQGDLAQRDRDKVMRAFKKERSQFLVATDVAARGIDVAGLRFVLHHQLPDQLEYYTHRSGRTARAGNKGTSLVLIEPQEKPQLNAIAQKLRVEFTEWRR
jgi:ATP-dependent RNA helicase DeaD